MPQNVLQKLAEICTIGLFLLAIYTTFSDKFNLPLLLAQRYSPLLLFIAFLSLIIAFIVRKRTLRKNDEIITSKGTQPLPYPYSNVEIEVFYPKTFEHAPNLTLRFPKKSGPRGRRFDVGDLGQPEYRLKEQRPDGFKLEIFSLGYSKPEIEWLAEGELKVKEGKKKGKYKIQFGP